MFNDLRNVWLLYKAKAPKELRNNLLRASLQYYSLSIILNGLHLPILIPVWISFALNAAAEILMEAITYFYHWVGLKNWFSKYEAARYNARHNGRVWYNSYKTRLRAEQQGVKL